MQLRKIKWPVLAALCITGSSYLASLTMPLLGPSLAHAADGKATPTVSPAVTAPLVEMSQAFRTVHNAVKDAVVDIRTSRKASSLRAEIPENFRRMLPPELLPPDEQDTPAPRSGRGGGGGAGGDRLVEYGEGSGVIISGDGYIVTNNHVVEDADEIMVRTEGGEHYKAKVIGRDPKADLAVVKIDAKNLTYAKFGDSDGLDVGDWVLAFGSPFGFDQTMTQGIISAKGRSGLGIVGSENPALQGLTYEDFLQTDAAINPGNSGGPLVNLQGEVVGINTAIASRTASYAGIGFAIPSNDVKSVVDSLIATGKVVRGYMGVGIEDINDPIHPEPRAEAHLLGFEGKAGVLVSEIKANSPGGRGGLSVKDIIVAINGKPVENINQLRSQVARTKPGDKITLEVYRDGKNVPVTFAVGTQPDTIALARTSQVRQEAAPSMDLDDLGISVKKVAKGLEITDIDAQGKAASRGLEKGDVIFNVQGKDVHDTDEFKNALSKIDMSKGLVISVHAADGSDRSVLILNP